MYKEVNSIYEKVKDVNSNCCVTIKLNTHRTKPDIQKDVILLKNLIREAEERLLKEYDRSMVSSIIKKIKQLSETIDHSLNQKSMLLFVNNDIAEIARLSVEVENHVIISNTFATRDIVRDLNDQVAYYILLLGRDEAKLMEAVNDKEERTQISPFPINNTNGFLKNNRAVSIPQKIDTMIEEFFNRVDKSLNSVWKEKQLPVLICTEERNYHHYISVSDNKNIIGHLNESKLNEKPGNIASAAWPVVHEWKKNNNRQRLEELYKALNVGNYLSTADDIWRAVNEGRGRTLFVQDNYLQPAKIVDNHIEIADTKNQNNVVEDIIDDMIEINLKNGGDVIFLSGNELKDFQGLALTTRY